MSVFSAKKGDTVICEDGVILEHKKSGREYLAKNSNKGTGFVFQTLNKMKYYKTTISNYIEFIS